MPQSDGYRTSSLIPAEKTDYERVKRDGWRDNGILVVSMEDDRLGWDDRELLKVIGEKLYGKRRDAI